MRTTTKARAAGLGLAVVTSTVVLALAPPQCSSNGTSVPDASDGATDGELRDHITAQEAGDDGACAQPLDDAGRISDWPGWQRFAFDPCCAVDVALDASSSLPSLTWIACLNGAPGCLELQPRGLLGTIRAQLVAVETSLPDSGIPKYLHVVWLANPALFESDLYDFAAAQPLAGWRQDETNGSCFFAVLPAPTSATLETSYSDGTHLSLANGDPASLASNPSYTFVSNDLRLRGLVESASSDSTYAFGLEPGGTVGRLAIGSSAYVTAIGPDNFHLGLVVGGDVFAWSEHGAAGWGQLYLVDATGALVLFRANPSAHVAELRTDGPNLYWTETYGTQDVNAPQQHTEVWTAPYTNDPTTLTATAKKIGDVPNTMYPINSIAFGGIYAFETFAEQAAILVRAGDGAVRHVPGPGTYVLGDLVYVSENELWALAGAAPPDGGTDPGHLLRVALTDW